MEPYRKILIMQIRNARIFRYGEMNIDAKIITTAAIMLNHGNTICPVSVPHIVFLFLNRETLVIITPDQFSKCEARICVAENGA